MAVEGAFGIAIPSAQTAQMNFANINGDPTSVCSEVACKPLALRLNEPTPGRRSPFSFVREAFAGQPQSARPTGDGNPPPDDNPKTRDDHARVIVRAFAVAGATKPYQYVEPAGGLGWSIPVKLYANVPYSAKIVVNNPRAAERTFVRGKLVEIAAAPRRVLLTASSEVPKGVAAPRLNVSAFTKLGNTAMAAGAEETVQLVIQQGEASPTDTGMGHRWIWALVALIIVVVIVAIARRKP